MTSSLFSSVWKLDFRTALILTQLSHTSSSEQKFHDFAQFSSHFDYFFLLRTLLHLFILRRKNFVLRQMQRSAWRFQNRESCTVNAERWTLNPERWTLNPEPWTLNPEPWTLNHKPRTWIVNRESWILYWDNKTVMTRYRPRRPVELCRNELVCFFLFFFFFNRKPERRFIHNICLLSAFAFTL